MLPGRYHEAQVGARIAIDCDRYAQSDKPTNPKYQRDTLVSHDTCSRGRGAREFISAIYRAYHCSGTLFALVVIY